MQIPHCLGTQETSQGYIYGKLHQELRTILSRLCQYKGVQVVEGMLCADHVHMCLAIPPKYSVSTIVGYLKGKSAIIVFESYSRLKRNFKGHSFWARGYYVNTVGLDEVKVRRYIQDQELNDAAEDSYNNDLSDPF